VICVAYYFGVVENINLSAADIDVVVKNCERTILELSDVNMEIRESKSRQDFV